MHPMPASSSRGPPACSHPLDAIVPSACLGSNGSVVLSLCLYLVAVALLPITTVLDGSSISVVPVGSCGDGLSPIWGKGKEDGDPTRSRVIWGCVGVEGMGMDWNGQSLWYPKIKGLEAVIARGTLCWSFGTSPGAGRDEPDGRKRRRKAGGGRRSLSPRSPCLDHSQHQPLEPSHDQLPRGASVKGTGNGNAQEQGVRMRPVPQRTGAARVLSNTLLPVARSG